MTKEKTLPISNALIIEDEPDMRYLLAHILKQKQITTLLAGSIDEANEVLKNTSSPEIIFLDNRLPDGSGITYFQQLKNRHPRSKIIMISAHDTAVDKAHARVVGINKFIGKPFTRDSIYKAIEALQGGE